MPYFLAVYTMTRADLAKFRAMPKADQDAVDAKGVPEWKEWDKRHAAAIVNQGGMVGKTTRIARDGTIAPASNDFCGYVIVEAENAEAAARLFADHPHINTFPGDGVDIMPFLTGPDL
ncbi:hypothetical protein [Devosia sp. XK-2]|uniref:hypothetical protein n=1 Tax=Devosia sp. XK-2 TaxID=3126689 RepID=UPI0030CBB2E4